MAHCQQTMPFQARLLCYCMQLAHAKPQQAAQRAPLQTDRPHVRDRAEGICLPAWTFSTCMCPPLLTGCWRCGVEQLTTCDPAAAVMFAAITAHRHSALLCWLRR